MYDLAVINGRVIDPGENLDKTLDIGVAKGRIEALSEKILPSEASQVIDARGKIVAPGLIDMHCHVYYAFTLMGNHPDTIGVSSGVTTVVDAGSAGSAVFGGFPEYVIPDAITNVYCFLNLSRTGQVVMPEIIDDRDINLEATKQVVEENRGLIRGIKLRAIGPVVYTLGPLVVEIAKKLATDVGLPIMVHIGDPGAGAGRTLTREVLSTLGKGDILSHVYTGKPGGALGANNLALPELRSAIQRGVIMDVAHGQNNMSFPVARRLLDQGILPDIISSDLTTSTIGRMVYSLTETMSKFLALGLTLNQVVQMTTINPARALGLHPQLGSLQVGREADVSILEVVEGDWQFADAEGNVLQGNMALVPVVTVKSGETIAAELAPRFTKFWRPR